MVATSSLRSGWRDTANNSCLGTVETMARSNLQGVTYHFARRKYALRYFSSSSIAFVQSSIASFAFPIWQQNMQGSVSTVGPQVGIWRFPQQQYETKSEHELPDHHQFEISYLTVSYSHVTTLREVLAHQVLYCRVNCTLGWQPLTPSKTTLNQKNKSRISA